MSTARPGAGTTKTPGQLFALVFGAVYVLIGILGFIDPLVSSDDKLLGIFGISALHNVAHLAVGALLLIGSRAPDRATATQRSTRSAACCITRFWLPD